MKTSQIHVFDTRLGWMALAVRLGAVQWLTFGHPTPRTARAGTPPELADCPVVTNTSSPLVRRLRAYARGQPDDFRDVAIDLGAMSAFRRRVLFLCRQIPYGKTTTYAQLAAQAGNPRAARAVGSVMACNRIPLLIPCHRVVRKDGRIGAYSAVGGETMKR